MELCFFHSIAPLINVSVGASYASPGEFKSFAHMIGNEDCI